MGENRAAVVSVAAASENAVRGAFFPHRSSERTRQARSWWSFRSGWVIGSAEHRRNTLAHFPPQTHSRVCCENRLWSVQQPSTVGNRPHLRNQAGEAKVSLFASPPPPTFLHFFYFPIYIFITLIGVNVALTSCRAVGECNHVSIYVVIVFKSEATAVFRLIVIQARSCSGFCICSRVQIWTEGIWFFVPIGIWSNFSPNWRNIRMWTKWHLETSPSSWDQTCCGWTTKGETAKTHGCSVSFLYSKMWFMPTCKGPWEPGCQ